MESALRHFRDGYSSGDRIKTILALNMIANNQHCAMDDMKASKNLFQSCFCPESCRKGLLSSAQRSLEKWIPICALLSNCNFLEREARSNSIHFRKCLVTAVERANAMLNFFIDSLTNTEQNPHFATDIELLVVLCARMRRSARHLASFGCFDFDPVSLYKKTLLKCYFFLLKSLNKVPRTQSEIIKRLRSGLADVLIELWRVFPFSIGVEIHASDIRKYAFCSSPEKASLLYFYYAMYLLNSGNLKGTETALTKSISYQCHSHEMDVFFFWAVVNMHRGQIPRVTTYARFSINHLKGVSLALQTGRVDLFDAACLVHTKHFLRMNMMLVMANIRQVVFRNMLAKHKLLHANGSEQMDLQELWDENKGMLEIIGGDVYFPSVSFLRDTILLPLFIQKYVNGCIHIDHGVLNLSSMNAFPTIELPSGPLPQPPEPCEK